MKITKAMKRSRGKLKLNYAVDPQEFEWAINESLSAALDQAFDDDSSFMDVPIISGGERESTNPLEARLFLNGFQDDGSKAGAQPVFTLDVRSLFLGEVRSVFDPGRGWEDEEFLAIKQVRDALRALADEIDGMMQEEKRLEAQEKAMAAKEPS